MTHAVSRRYAHARAQVGRPSSYGRRTPSIAPEASPSASVSVSAAPARHAREPIDIPAETQALWQAGKLEQTCSACGRWSAATRYCSWCFRPMGPADWYRNGDKEQRAARMPKEAPADPPNEYREVRAWPAAWGRCPYRRAALEPARVPQTPLRAPSEANPVVPSIWPESPSSALSASLPSGALSGAEVAHPSPPDRAG
jgi:hypothetical protein